MNKTDWPVYTYIYAYGPGTKTDQMCNRFFVICSFFAWNLKLLWVIIITCHIKLLTIENTFNFNQQKYQLLYICRFCLWVICILPNGFSTDLLCLPIQPKKWNVHLNYDLKSCIKFCARVLVGIHWKIEIMPRIRGENLCFIVIFVVAIRYTNTLIRKSIN